MSLKAEVSKMDEGAGEASRIAKPGKGVPEGGFYTAWAEYIDGLE